MSVGKCIATHNPCSISEVMTHLSFYPLISVSSAVGQFSFKLPACAGGLLMAPDQETS